MIKDYVGLSNKGKVYQMGNPRFDQVISDAKQISEIDKKPILQRQNILLFGSMHHEDRNIVLSHTMEYLEKNENLEIIWASHEPDEQDNRYLESMFSRRGVSVGRVNSIEDIKTSEERVKIINVVGILAKLYWRVKIAYIGGGFSTGVHNLMEPSVAEVPTIFGPNYKNFDEAVEIINNKSGFCIKNGREFIESLDSLLSDEKKLLLASTSAKELITKNSGASSKIVEEILAN
jgi:3-deoxy-D-manno-octulosonic-acid transferase